LCQRKHTLDLLGDMGMMGCLCSPYLIEQNHQVTLQSCELVNKEDYKKLVGRLSYLYKPRSNHLDIVHSILRYLKGIPGKGLWFAKSGHLEVDGHSDSDWTGCQDDRRSTSGYCVFVGEIFVSWRSKIRTIVSRSTTKDEYRAFLKGSVRCSG
jgi:hypothetical protein